MCRSINQNSPRHIGRYQITRALGDSGFGIVYLAYDQELDRLVALKVPHAKLVSSPADAERYLAVARTVANLDHPHIVPIYDAGSTDECPCYVVGKYVEGCDLATKLQQMRLTYTEAVQLVAKLAEALHYAHTEGVVHRNVKPSNILVGVDGTPYVVDFGLVREWVAGRAGDGWRVTGGERRGSGEATFPATHHAPPTTHSVSTTQSGPITRHPPRATRYLSPEQTRGEGHRVDARSDVFSLGAVLYELLAGPSAFREDKQAEPCERATSFETCPVTQYDDQIPIELGRICDRALAKLARDRYGTAKEFAEDLWNFLVDHAATKGATASETADVTGIRPESTSKGTFTESTGASGSVSSDDSPPLRIVPKGLCSFDAHDADYFLELVPGPRDRNGLPNSIRFWKARIEETDPEATFPVGLIYGPSGCGKSSFVKAGLLPRLSEDIIVVYLEAMADETETRLLHNLRRRCTTLDQNLNLKETLSALRRGQGIPTGKRLLIILDQFEQWLRVNKEEELTELAQALRQCDGSRLQCIVMVRDEFWLATTRFMNAVEVDLRQGQNSALADLFDVDHARKVLAAFGRAFGKLPQRARETSNTQKQFLRQAVSGLADEGKVICVRLALFAEMMKGKTWTPATLKEAGGAQGVGVTFLETTFNASTAHPKHRLHQRAARAVLKALLPDPGSDIKGEMKSSDELLDASGYTSRPQDFADLLRILDSELHLITPTEGCWVEGGEWRVTGEVPVSNTEHRPPATERVAGEGFVPTTRHPPLVTHPTTHHPPHTTHRPLPATHYQLAHDYLVPSLREWLTRKQRETRRGRAELCLAERDSLWIRKREDRYLPSAWECLRIAGLTAGRNWTTSQRDMMRRATRLHGIRWGFVLLFMLVVAAGISQFRSRRLFALATNAVEDMEKTSGQAVPLIIEDLKELPDPDIVLDLLSRARSSKPNLSLGYALAEFGEVDTAFVISEIADASPEEVDNVVKALGRSKDKDGLLAAVRETAAACDTDADWCFKARLAIVALHLGDSDLAADMCELRPDPIQRSTFIDECTSWHGDLRQLAGALPKKVRAPLRSALCSGIGSIPQDRLQSDVAKRKWADIFTRWHQEADSGTHSAADWALRTWQEKLPGIEPSPVAIPGRDWYVTKQGITMVKIPKGALKYKVENESIDGGIPSVDERSVTVEQPIWLADREVTVGVFRKFADETDDVEWIPDTRYGEPSDSDPVSEVSWIEAVKFCNWLSAKEDLEACYRRVDEEGTILFDRWRVKDEPTEGYRLPTKDEWIFACRAGSQMRTPYDNDAGFLHQYSVHLSDRPGHLAGRAETCGSALPNRWGLFDMYGNVEEWCYPIKFDDDAIVLLGGSFHLTTEQLVKSQGVDHKAWRNDRFWRVYGFRVARSSGQTLSSRRQIRQRSRGYTLRRTSHGDHRRGTPSQSATARIRILSP